MTNSTTVLFGPQPAGIGNKHVYAISMSVDTYSSGVSVSVPASITKPMVFVHASGGYVGDWDAENSKVKLYSTAGTEVSSLGSAVTVNVLFIGQ